MRPNEVTEESSDDHHSHDSHGSHGSHHSHEDYFQRQQNRFGKIKITKAVVFKARKKEYLIKKKLMERLKLFHDESQEMQKLNRDRDLESQINQKIIKNEVIEIADRLELMEKTLNEQNLKILMQQAAFRTLSQKMDPNP